MRRSFLLALLCVLGSNPPLHAQEQDLTNLDLDTLMGMDVAVTTAARRAQTASESAAAVYVLSREDIRRSGATSLPDALRAVPGLHVARINSRAWAVTSRGFSNRFANKLLVMIDGRSVYSPVFSGMMWEEQSIALEEIERVEIVRGPGGALWGLNAVNGVINVITRKAADARGLAVNAGAGSIAEQSAGVSYGATSELLGNFRTYVDHAKTDAMGSSPSWSHTQAGFRIDRDVADGFFTLQGDIDDSDYGPVAAPPNAQLPDGAQTGNLTASLQRGTALGQLELRGYYGRTQRGSPSRWTESALGFDLQLAADRRGAHVLTAGIGYRHLEDAIKEYWSVLSTNIPRVEQDQFSIYAQDEIYLANDDVRITAGVKLEDHEFTGLAVQPTLRALWAVTAEHTIWAAASRAVRTPARFEFSAVAEYSGVMPNGMLATYRFVGDSDLQAEDLNAYELGWRWRPVQNLSIDLALYRNEYENLISSEPLPPQMSLNQIVMPSNFVNLSNTNYEGAEVSVEWLAQTWLRFIAQGAWQQRSGDWGASIPDDPSRMLMLRTSLDLPREVELDLDWRAVTAIPRFEGYDALDARLAWLPTRTLEVSLSVENVLNNEHIEFVDQIGMQAGASLGRTYFAKLVWRPKG